MNAMQQAFQQRNAAELRLAEDEIKWWEQLVSSHRVARDQAAGYIAIQQYIVRVKRIVLGLDSVS